MNAFELQHIRDIAARNRRISRAVDDAMKDLARRFTTVKGRRFAGVMKRRLADLHDQVLADSQDGIRNQWAMAGRMNDKKLAGYLAGMKVSDAMMKSFRAPNVRALNAFLDRADAGMNLSDRVWNFTEGVQEQMEDLIAKGVLEGKSAASLSKELQRFIKGSPIPYEGTLIKARNLTAQAIRVAATEMNMAFRTADYLQNSTLPFVTGVTVHLSNEHPAEDICDEMAGEYPKEFQFEGWHPNCICYATYETIPKEEMVAYLQGGEIDQSRMRGGIPDRARSYLAENGERLEGYKNQPYWLRDNKSILERDGA